MAGIGGSFGGSFGSYNPNRDPFGQPPPPPTSQYGNPATFTAAANQQASDYDTIMKQYQDFVSRAATNPITSTNVTPQAVQYNESADVKGSLANLSDLSKTGGYSEQGIQDLRARGISPTRSIYANAQENVDRQRALGGGYSPNFNATQAQLARDESNQISDINTNVNAGIAQNVAANRLAASGTYAGASAAENAARTGVDEANASRALEAGTGNANRAFEAQLYGRQNILAGIEGQKNLYGTTPALTNTFGNQVVQAGQLGQGQQELNQRQNQNLWGNVGRFA